MIVCTFMSEGLWEISSFAFTHLCVIRVKLSKSNNADRLHSLNKCILWSSRQILHTLFSKYIKYFNIISGLISTSGEYCILRAKYNIKIIESELNVLATLNTSNT